MHAPDGFLTVPVAVGTGLLSAGAIGAAVRQSREHLGERQVPLAGLTAAFVFAAQLVNFPVAAGTTGHLMGGALAAVLLGPWVGMLVVGVVVIVQVFFADGGVTALGYNLLNMAIVTSLGGWGVFRLGRRVLPRTRAGVVLAAGFAGFSSVVISAAAFSLEWLFGASAPVAFDRVFGAMVGIHVLIGIGEGVITGLTVAAVLAARADLVTGAGDLDLPRQPARRGRPFALGALAVALVVAAGVSQFAAEDPDGLERVAEDTGFAASAQDHPFGNSIFADYATAGVADESTSLAIAGISGTLLTLAVGGGLFSAVRRRRPAAPSPTQRVG
ncbi:MAG TPA: energy-coupling factor ABC transporter permease [Egicoccus sp.]|nr:energy-coupling factor ABC transporter permease [Egicoccus sp.]HSK23655.1 energy-coupling factor ABC transporter permease [Egicoccus sp.]